MNHALLDIKIKGYIKVNGSGHKIDLGELEKVREHTEYWT